MSYRLIDQVRRSQLPPTLKLVAWTLANYARDDGRSIYPGLARLVTETGLGRATVYRALRALQDRGVLQVEQPHAPHRPTHYRLEVSSLPMMREAKQLALSFPQGRTILLNTIRSFPQ
jgi:hypothetical protein